MTPEGEKKTKCPYCGNTVRAGIFCSECGKKLVPGFLTMTKEERQEYKRYLINRFTMPTNDVKKMLRFLELADRIGLDDMEFILRSVRVDLRFEDLRTEEKVMKYLTPVLTGILCVIIHKLLFQ